MRNYWDDESETNTKNIVVYDIQHDSSLLDKNGNKIILKNVIGFDLRNKQNTNNKNNLR